MKRGLLTLCSQIRPLSVAVLLVGLAHSMPGTAQAATPIRVLIVDGQQNHNWKLTTPELKVQLQAGGLCTVDVATTPPAGSPAAAWAAFSPKFGSYDVVVLNYFGEDWPSATLDGLIQFVHNGGGLATFHAGGSSFAKNDAYNRMIGLAWRSADVGDAVALDKNEKVVRTAAGKGTATGHSAIVPFTVVTRAPAHPIMRGLPSKWEHVRDEMYHSMRGVPDQLEILATALSPLTGLNEPMAWTVKYGRGRVFGTALGHDVTAMRDPGFTTLMVHGIEWAATGNVTSLGMVRPLSNTILSHLDRSVPVHGPYAAVKLPIHGGIPLHNPTAVTVGPHGKIYVANYTGQILRLEDTDGDGLEDTAELFADVTKDGKEYPFADAVKYPNVPQSGGLRYPTALLFKGGDCYVATTQEIRIYTDTNGDGVADTSRTFANGWPFTMHYFDWTFGLRFGPDGWLYSILSSDYGNGAAAPDPKGLRGSILRISPDGKTIERFAYGLRFPYGLAFNEAGDLFFSDNEGSGNSTEEINHAVKGGNYGHSPKLADSPPRDPILRIQPHMSANGIEFNPTSNDFGGTAGDLFIACWGPDGAWNIGAVRRARLTKSSDGTYTAEDFPFSDGPGKVISLCFGTRGDLYVAQFGPDKNPGHLYTDKPFGNIYRFIYSPDLTIEQATRHKFNPLKNQIAGDPARGKEIAAQRACLKCHNADGSGDLLGPDLKHLWAVFGKERVLEAIEKPSKVIATGYEMYNVITADGLTYQGRLLSGEGDHVRLLTLTNEKVDIPRAEIESMQLSTISMMPDGLLANLSQSQIDDLLAYLRTLPTGGSTALRIKVGGGTLNDSEGRVWEADLEYEPGFYGYTGGLTSKFPNFSDPMLQTNRFGDFNYRFEADNGAYEMKLLFAEPYFHHPGERVFSVKVQGQDVIQNLDLIEEVGFGKIFSKSVPVQVIDGTIKLDFSASSNHAILNGIEIRPIP